MLLPALSKAKQRTQAIYCMNNCRQMMIAWLGFTHDNNDSMVSAGSSESSWVSGWLDWTTASDNTNTINLASDSIAFIAPSLALKH